MSFRVKLVLAALHGLLLIVFILNAWMADDGYITFRSVEQLIAGNGLRWNSFERVQAYTSVLWFFLLALFRVLITDIYYAALALSLVCCATTIWITRRIVTDTVAYGTLLLVLIASPSVVDFTTSGLENPLGYLLLATFCWLIFSVDSSSLRQKLPAILIVVGLAPLVRHDLAILVWPIAALLLFHHRRFVRDELRTTCVWIVMALVPLAVWTLFSLIYYGSPVPNTAHAKLNTGMNGSDLLRAGINYVWISCRDDPVAGLLLLVGIGAGWWRGGIYRAISMGILLHIAYVIKIGGDFMRGRFLSFEVLLAALMLAHMWRPVGVRVAAFVVSAALLVLVVSPFSSLFPAEYFRNSLGSLTYAAASLKTNNGVIDEKHGYFPYTGLMPRLRGEAVTFYDEVCERGPNCVRSDDLRQCPLEAPYAKCTQVTGMIGAFGYRAGHTARIIDNLALTDPLLARLPTPPGVIHRAGHAPRPIPRGYVESVDSGRNLIEDPRVAALYDQVKLVTQSDDLFSTQRLHAIWLLNTGQLKHLAVFDYPHDQP